MLMHIIMVLLASILTQNMALTYILGMCPYIALSKKIGTAAGMGVAVIFVTTITAMLNWIVYYWVLVPLHSELIYYIVSIIVIAASVQLVEMIMEKFFPSLQASFGIFLPLITVNCIVLAVSLFFLLREYNFIETTVFAFGSSLGWVIAIIVTAAINEKLELVGDIPKGMRGPGIIMVIAGILALAFLGFAGMVKV